MSTSAFGVEHEISKAAHRRGESTVTASYGHKAWMNQHGRRGTRLTGDSTTIHIGNQRTSGGNGPGEQARARGFVRSVKVGRLTPKRAAAAGAGALAVAGAEGVRRHVKKSTFGVEHDSIAKGESCGCSCKSCKDDKSCSCDCAHCKPGSRELRKNAYCDYSMADKSMIGKFVGQAPVAPERIAKASELLAAAKRPSAQNTRRQNVAVGTGVGAATGAGIGTALGGLVGSQRAAGGLRALKSVGAAPSRLRRAEITAREAGRLGRKGGAVFGALGAAAGLQEGLTAPAKRKARKSSYEVS